MTKAAALRFIKLAGYLAIIALMAVPAVLGWLASEALDWARDGFGEA